MRKRRLDKIGPNPVWSVVLLTCVIGSTYLLSIGFYGSVPRGHPAAILTVAIVAFCVGYKTIYFSNDAISVVYLLAIRKRKIPWEDISCINIVDDRYIYVALADCPLYEETDLRFQTYALLYRRKIIVIDVFTEKQKEKYLHIIQKYYQPVKHIKGHENGSAST